MEIQRVGSKPSAKGPSDWLTGTVRIDYLFDREDPSRVGGASVTFEPRAGTAWHTHPLGQTLIVTSGCGWAQQEGGPLKEIRPGAEADRVSDVAAPNSAPFHLHFLSKDRCRGGHALDYELNDGIVQVASLPHVHFELPTSEEFEQADRSLSLAREEEIRKSEG